jgi:eukaryotic-like serine/threonine-protein kinase
MPPSVIGPYRVFETLGSGGVGTVYRAVDRKTGEPVALKLLSTGPALDPKAARRLAREFEALCELSHPNVVKVFDTGVFQGYPYLAMELVEGLTLRHYLSLRGGDAPSSEMQELILSAKTTDRDHSAPVLREGDRLTHEEDAPSFDPPADRKRPFSLERFAEESPSEEGSYITGPESVRAFADEADEPDTAPTGADDSLLPYEVGGPPEHERRSAVDLSELNRPERICRLKDAMLQLCRALEYIHGHGLVHRDLKPSNIMVDQDHLVRLMDFGLAKFLADDAVVTADGKLVGTFRYMPPEQILGEPLDGRGDLYSLGVILYELLSGRPPFDAKAPYELWRLVLETEPLPISVWNPKADAQLSRVAHRLIRKEPEARYQTAEEVYEAIAE